MLGGHSLYLGLLYEYRGQNHASSEHQWIWVLHRGCYDFFFEGNCGGDPYSNIINKLKRECTGENTYRGEG